MSKTVVLLILISSFLIGQSEIRDFRIETKYENWDINQSELISGYYYHLSHLVGDSSASGLNPRHLSRAKANMIYGFLLAKGIKLKESWFQGGSSSCGVYDVIVFPSLSIRTESSIHELTLKELGFSKVERPMFSCPRSVEHSTFYYDE